MWAGLVLPEAPARTVASLFRLLEVLHPWLVALPPSSQPAAQPLPALTLPCLPPPSGDPVITLGLQEIQGHPHLRGINLIPSAESLLPGKGT